MTRGLNTFPSCRRIADAVRRRSPARGGPGRTPRRFLRAAEGAAAVEFALVSLPFLALVGGIFQVAFQMWAAQNFDRALQNGVRTIFTGQFQQNNKGKDKVAQLTALKDVICGPASATIVNVFNCRNLKIDVDIKSSFGDAAASTPMNKNSGTWSDDFGTKYACARAGAIVIVTAAVQFPTFFNLLGLSTKKFTTGDGVGSGLLTSTAVFRTEPYQLNGTDPCTPTPT